MDGVRDGCGVERLNSLDAVCLAKENRVTPMNVGSVGVFEGPAPSFATVRMFIASKVDGIQRCRQRVYEMPGKLMRPVWIDDVNFDIDDHVHHVTLPPDQRNSPEETVAHLMALPLRRDRALWDVWVINGSDENRWAVVSKIHHCMADGIAGTDLLALILDREPGVASPPVRSQPRARAPSTVEIVLFSVAALAASSRARVSNLVKSLTSPRERWNHLRNIATGARGLWLQPSHRDSPLTGPIGSRRRWSHARISLDDVATIRHVLGGTVNDVVLAATASGFREMLRARGVAVEGRTIMAMVPVSTRAADEHGLLDNRVAVTHALLPVDIDDPITLFTALRTQLGQVKRSHETDASTLLLHSGDVAPQVIARAVARGVGRLRRNLETVVTNVPGSPAQSTPCIWAPAGCWRRIPSFPSRDRSASPSESGHMADTSISG